MSLVYANEKLHRVIDHLTTGEEAIVERLRGAGSPYLGLLSEDSFPAEVRPVWNEINETFREDMRLKNLTQEKAVDLVRKLLNVKFVLEEHLNRK